MTIFGHSITGNEVGDGLLIVVTVLYFLASVAYAADHHFPKALTLFAYAVANVGFIWAADQVIR